MNPLRRPTAGGKDSSQEAAMVSSSDLIGEAATGARPPRPSRHIAGAVAGGASSTAGENPRLGGSGASSAGARPGSRGAANAGALLGGSAIPGTWPGSSGVGAWPGGSGAGATSSWPGSSGAGATSSWPGGCNTATTGQWPGASGTAVVGMWPGGSATATAGSWPGGSGLPEWWPSISMAALGPNWLSSEAGAAAVFPGPSAGPFVPSLNNTTVSAPVQATSVPNGDERRSAAAAVDKDIPVQAKGTSRRGKKRPRPPIPASASNDILDLTVDASVAHWSDNNVKILCEILEEEVNAGNRSSTHLNKTGYKNLIKKFQERTGLLYTRRQFKNRWDKLKVEYGVWKRLLSQTGLGWKEGSRDIDMPEEWWIKMDKIIKGASKFQGLQNEDKLRVIFEDLRNTGDDHWNPSSGLAPSETSNACEGSTNNGDGKDEDDEEDSGPEEVTPASSKGNRVVQNDKKKDKKPKTSGGQRIQEHLDEMRDQNERLVAACELVARKEDKSGCSIEEVMALVRGCGAVPGTNEHFTATLVFTKRAERQMFMTLLNPEERFQWLSTKHQWISNTILRKSPI